MSSSPQKQERSKTETPAASPAAEHKSTSKSLQTAKPLPSAEVTRTATAALTPTMERRPDKQTSVEMRTMKSQYDTNTNVSLPFNYNKLYFFTITFEFPGVWRVHLGAFIVR